MNKVIAIVGPTAIGKTKISIEIAKKYNLDIISGDSVSVYKGLDIGSAKPTKEEMGLVKHHLIDVCEPTVQYSVFDFQKATRKIIDENPISLICGGTGLYIQSVLFDYEFEAGSRNEEFENQFKDYTNDELYNYLLELDPNIDQEKLHKNNLKRVLRAIEIIKETGKPLAMYQNKDKALYDYFIVYLNVSNRDILYDRINKRVDQMMCQGLLNEVKALYDKNILPHAIGYKEFVPYFRGEISLDEAIEEIKKNSRHLAKRQITWFKNQMSTNFYDVDLNNISNTIDKICKDIDVFLNRWKNEDIFNWYARKW